MLTIKNARKYFDAHLVLDIPHLELDNNLYWVKGENGAGKSTLLKMIAGLLPFEGDISFLHTDLHRNPVLYKRQVSWADADPLFPAFMTGSQLMQFYARIRRASSQQPETLASVFGMKELIHSKTGTYSTGALKKLSLMLAFLGNPALILLDEPLITLDSASLARVCELIYERQKTGSLLMVSSHEEHDPLAAFSDKRIFVNNHTVQLT